METAPYHPACTDRRQDQTPPAGKNDLTVIATIDDEQMSQKVKIRCGLMALFQQQGFRSFVNADI
jgi:hypothetical protein